MKLVQADTIITIQPPDDGMMNTDPGLGVLYQDTAMPGTITTLGRTSGMITRRHRLGNLDGPMSIIEGTRMGVGMRTEGLTGGIEMREIDGMRTTRMAGEKPGM